MSLALHRTPQRQTGSAGFTLLELMVVVAVAGVLSALLLPALSTAKEKSRRCVCKENIRQDLLALEFYADGEANEDGLLPTPADNSGAYHAIRLSDSTFSAFTNGLSGESNSLYCPNLAFATGQMGGYSSSSGYSIGYSYLATLNVDFNYKGPDPVILPQKASDTGTNALLADANYWSLNSSQPLTVAPHSGHGAVVALAVVSPLPTSATATTTPSLSAAVGGMGGNVGYIDTHVEWRPMSSMTTSSAANDNSAMLNK
jgi:prepilin-type N-terminal cleavage/methylation domain-containing protein